MKKILTWVKSNLLIVGFCLAILLVLPGAYIASSIWRQGTFDEQKKAGEAELQSVSKLDVTYSLPSYQAGTPAVEVKSVPNTELTNWFKANKTKLSDANTAIVKRVEDFNQGAGDEAAQVGRARFTPLVEGVFPDPKNADDKSQRVNEMEEALLGKKGLANPYDALLASVRAGSPADPVKVAEALSDQSQRESEKITAGKRALTPDEQALLNKQLAERRLSEYQAAAKSFSVYASLESLPRDNGGRSIPRNKIDQSELETHWLFLYQWDLWFLQDIFAAVRLANTDSTAKPTDIDRSVVKRIESISLLPPKGIVSSKNETEDTSAPAGAAPVIPGMVMPDPRASITAREMGAANKVYDIRRATLSVVVSSARINDFLDAITRTNLMTVTDLDVTAVDEWNDLKEGYYYGQEGVVRAQIGIESIWLRSWTAPLMPKLIASLLGAAPQSSAEGAGTSQVPAADGSAAPTADPSFTPRGRGAARPPG